MTALDANTLTLDGTQFIEASAGTGKTFTLATLFTRLVVERGFDVSEILVVTYTEAAASELAERIRERLRQAKEAAEARRAGLDPGPVEAPVFALLDRAAERPGGLDEAHARLALALHGFDERAISTIHGFCLRALQEHAFESGASFDLELVGADRELVTDVAWDHWSSTLNDASPALIDALRSTLVGGVALGPERIGELIAKVSADPRLAVHTAAPAEPLDTAIDAWWAAWRVVSDAWSDDVVALLRSGAVHRGTYNESRIEKKLPALMRRLETAHLPGLVGDEAVTLELLRPAKLEAKTGKNKPTPEHAVFDTIDALLEADTRLSAAKAGAVANVLRDAIDHGVAALADRKRRAGIQFFDDLLRDLADALRGENGDALAARMRAQTPVALIDEFQDTDPVQYEIFRDVFTSAGCPIFLVGDPKQAIYGFRGADVFAYLRARRESGVAPHDLATNWRSDPGLIDAVNAVFGDAHRPFVIDDIDYRPVAARPNARDLFDASTDDVGPPFEVLRLDESPRGGGWAKGQAEEAAAHVVAEDVVRLLAADTGADGRALGARDVAVLCRTHRQGRRMKKTLDDWGVAAVEVGESSVFDSAEAEELEWVLRGLLAAGDLRRVRAALGTRLVGLDAAGLQALEADPAAWDPWLGRLARWRELWLSRGILAALETLTEETGAFPRLLEEEAGERAVTNFEQLFELLHDAAGRDRLGPESALAWLTRQRLDPGARDHSAREQAKIRLESDADAVQIVTVHASKGLEYPVVYCPFLFDPADPMGAERSWVRFHDEANDGRGAVDLGSDAFDAHAREAERELLAEHVRLLYVALTRAAHRCVVVWGRLAKRAGQHRSALAYLLHQPEPDVDAVAADWVSVVQARAEGIELEDFDADLARLEARAGGAVRIRGVASGTPPDKARVVPEAPELEALHAARVLDAQRRTSSFSGLVSAAKRSALERGDTLTTPVRDVAPSDEGLDHDARLQTSVDPAAIEPGVARPDDEAHAIALADFPAGALVGTAVHGALEHLDFERAVDPAALAGVRARLEQGGVPASYAAQFAAAVPALVAAPLAGGAGAPRLCDVALSHRVDEMEFIVPVAAGHAGEAASGAVTPSDLARVFDRHATRDYVKAYAERLGRLDFLPLEGFLKGYVDLVFRRGERYHVVDYKSNLLGGRVRDYAPDRLVAPMLEHDYVLQYHLYVVALHRQLGWRLDGYDYERHVGDVFYLFLRGLSVDHPVGTGVYADRPPLELVEALSDLFGAPRRVEGLA